MADVMPGTTSKGTPAAASAAASSPPRANTNGSPPLSRTTRAPVRPALDQQVVDVVLPHADVSGRLAHVDALGPGRREVEQRLLRQAVVDDDVGARAGRRGPAR